MHWQRVGGAKENFYAFLITLVDNKAGKVYYLEYTNFRIAGDDVRTATKRIRNATIISKLRIYQRSFSPSFL